MKLGKYIHDLLLEHETVIIPGFGAFLSEYKPAEISETEIKPPSRQVSFSSNIRNNDGLLVGYVANQEKVSHFDALKIIEKERDNIIFRLDKGEEVTLEEIGKLFHNEKDRIQFTPFQDENLLMESFGLESVSLEKLDEEQPEEEPVVEEEIEVLPIVNEEQETTAEVTDEITESFEEGKVQETDKTQEEEINEVSEVVSDSTPEELEPEPREVTKEIPAPEEEKKKKAGWYWYLLILIPIIVASVYVIKNNAEKSQPVSTNSNNAIIQKEPLQSKSQMAEQPTAIPDSAEIIQPEEKQDSTKKVSVTENNEEEFTPGQPVYYLIGGSFKESEESAKEYMEELKEKGFEPFYMGKQGNFYTVGIGKYKTEGQAVRARDTIWLKYPKWHLWVMPE